MCALVAGAGVLVGGCGWMGGWVDGWLVVVVCVCVGGGGGGGF